MFNFSRRRFIKTGITNAALLGFGNQLVVGQLLAANLGDLEIDSYLTDRRLTLKRLAPKFEGLLLGSMIGDAMGGPLEFDEQKHASQVMPNLRDWGEKRRLTSKDIATLSESVPLHSYETLRPDPAPYGQWRESAPAGTVTDDTRHKIILIDALRRGYQENRSVVVEDLARSYLDFDQHACIAKHPEYKLLLKEGHEEFRLSSRWVLGERDPKLALPPERIWAGSQTCCGFMTLLPLACLFPGKPLKAYKAAFLLGFFDNGWAKDLSSSVVAALSTALMLQADPTIPEQRREAWQKMEATMLRIDPYRYADSPYTKKPSTRWIDYAHEVVREANGSPKKLFSLLEEECFQNHWWESHLIFVITFACAEFCDYVPLAAMHMVLDFGHDTDSSAQLLGAMIGAIHGAEIFSHEMRQTVKERLEEDYLEETDEWISLLQRLAEKPNSAIDFKAGS